jgi:iron complex outermembrane receptor protein/vitamin B12 transporter
VLKKAFMVIFCIQATYALSEQQLAPLIVSGSVIKDAVSTSVLSDYTVSRQQIQQAGYSTTVDALRQIPGINVTQQGGQGGLTFVSMRGGDPNFTSVIIDGVRVNDPTNSRGGGFDFSGLDHQLIEKIDVFFGGYSPVFGSEALAGVISITTLGVSDKNNASVVAELAEQNGHAESFHVSNTVANIIDLSLAGAYRKGGDVIEGDSLERKQIIFKAQPKYSDKFDWAFSYFASDGDATSFPEDSGGDQLAAIRTVEKRKFKQNNVAISGSYIVNKNWLISLIATQADHEEAINNPGIAAGIISGTPPILSDSDYQRRDISLTNSVSLRDTVSVGLGVEVTREDGQFDSILDFGFPLPASFSLKRDTKAAFTELSWEAADNLKLVAGLRYDDAENISETTARFIVNYTQSATERFFSFQYSEGFKLPSFFALGHPLVGNLNLKPELSKNLSFDVKQSFYNGAATATLSIFRNEFKDLVDFDPILFTSVNRSSVKAKGVTVELSLRPTPKLMVNSHVTYTNYKTDAGIKLRRRPEWKAGASVNWQIQKSLSLNINSRYVGSFYDSSIPSGLVKLDNYTDADVSVKKVFSQGLSISLITDNVFNNGYQETVGFSNAGRQVRLMTSLTFQ